MLWSVQGLGKALEASDRGAQGGAQSMPNKAVEAVAQPPAVDVVEAAHAALASLPAECATESDRLLALCEKLVEVRATLDAPVTLTPSLEGLDASVQLNGVHWSRQGAFPQSNHTVHYILKRITSSHAHS